MKKSIKNFTALVLCMTMLCSSGVINSFAKETNILNVESKVALHTARFPKTQKVSKTYKINVKPYGFPASKHIGNVTMHATIKYDEVWKVDSKGNKISYVGIENKRATSAYANYDLKLNCSVSNQAVKIGSGGKSVIISGMAKVSMAGLSGQDSYRFVYSV